jgi:competence protein ComFC
MGGVNVKNTMIEALMQIVAPHLCFGCGKIGTTVCDNCKYHISSEPFAGCILCGKISQHGICAQHDTPICKAWVVSERRDILKNTIHAYKFKYVKAAAQPLADLLDTTLPYLPANTVIVPIPTSPAHIRERGFDHIHIFARLLARRRSLPISLALTKSSSITQHRLNKSDRQREAKGAFVINKTVSIDVDAPVLLLDDVITTGSTVKSAANVLANVGVKTIYVAALAYQPLD